MGQTRSSLFPDGARSEKPPGYKSYIGRVVFTLSNVRQEGGNPPCFKRLLVRQKYRRRFRI